jgi:hypothetical protein
MGERLGRLTKKSANAPTRANSARQGNEFNEIKSIIDDLINQ